MVKPQLSGWCGTPATSDPEESHARCARMGAGNTARPSKEFQPCPCRCHYSELERYECECGGILVETGWENTDIHDADEDGNLYPVYAHIAPNGTLIGVDCR